MKLFLIITVVVLGLGGLFFITKDHDDSNTKVPALTMQTIQSDVANGAQLIDVRTTPEFTAGHINGAQNLSLQDIQAGKLPLTSKDATIYVYCHSGNRSSQATALLKSAGYKNIVDLGAMTHVQSLGGTVITS